MLPGLGFTICNKLNKNDWSSLTLVHGVENMVSPDVLVALFINFFMRKGGQASWHLIILCRQNRYRLILESSGKQGLVVSPPGRTKLGVKL